MPSLVVFELFGRLFACLLACLITCMLACLPACLLAYLHACLLACLPHFTSIGVAASGGVASLLRSIPSQPPWLLVAWPLCMCGLRCGPVVFAGSMAWRQPVTRSPHPSLHFDASLWLKQYHPATSMVVSGCKHKRSEDWEAPNVWGVRRRNTQVSSLMLFGT